MTGIQQAVVLHPSAMTVGKPRNLAGKFTTAVRKQALKVSPGAWNIRADLFAESVNDCPGFRGYTVFRVILPEEIYDEPVTIRQVHAMLFCLLNGEVFAPCIEINQVTLAIKFQARALV
jgi:hypothetical protein